jgi:glyoxylase-like metal-dependent hydrolase (beta-lactamase superfamily II)
MEHRKDIINPNPVYENVTTIVKLNGKDVKVHGLCAGTVAVKTTFKTKKGSGYLSKINILLAKYYTEYMPIWVWVIEHPEGLIVVDTGENSNSMEVDKYLSKESWYARYQFKNACNVKIQKQSEINNQLNKVNLKTEEVKLVVLTHMHLDHIDGLKYFPKQEIMVGNFEFTHPDNVFKSILPSWFNPNKLEYSQNRIEVFNQAYSITQAEDLLYIPTPGHTLGHSSLVFRTDDFDIIFAGDSSYDQAQVIKGELPGANTDYHQTARTYQKLLAYAGLRKTIYLPTHDADSGQRLLNKSFLI